jgi:hypothetical protein
MSMLKFENEKWESLRAANVVGTSLDGLFVLGSATRAVLHV